MKTDLATTVIAAIAGIVIAYFVTNIIIPGLEDVSFKNLSESVSTSLTDPDVDIFNFRAINPTVEVYVGQCTEYNEKGECIDGNYQTSEDETDKEEEANQENKNNTDEESPNEEVNGNTN